MTTLVSFLLSMIPGTLALSGSDIILKKLLSRGISERLLLGLSFGGAGMVLALLSTFLGAPEVHSGFFTAVAATVPLNVLGQFAWYRAFKSGAVSFVAPLRLLIPILVIGSGFLFLGEQPSLPGVAGIFVTVSGLWFLLLAEVGTVSHSFRAVLGSPALRWGCVGVVSFALSFPFDKQAVVASSALFAAGIIFPAIAVGSLRCFSRSANGETVRLLLYRAVFGSLRCLLRFIRSAFFLRCTRSIFRSLPTPQVSSVCRPSGACSSPVRFLKKETLGKNFLPRSSCSSVSPSPCYSDK